MSPEPSSTAIPITAIVALIAALGTVSVGVYAARNVRKIMNAQMVVKSTEDYGDLMEALTFIGTKFDRPENKPVFDRLLSCSRLVDFYEIKKDFEVETEDWKKAREIKTFFRTSLYLRKTGMIADDAFVLMVNHWGIELLHNVVQPLERYRFFESRLLRPDSIERHLETEFYWYHELRELIPEYDPSRLASKNKQGKLRKLCMRLKLLMGVSYRGS